MTSSIKPEVRHVSQRRQRRTDPRLHVMDTKFREDQSSGSRDMLTDRQTHRQADRKTDRNTPLPYGGRSNNNNYYNNYNYRNLYDRRRLIVTGCSIEKRESIGVP